MENSTEKQLCITLLFSALVVVVTRAHCGNRAVVALQLRCTIDLWQPRCSRAATALQQRKLVYCIHRPLTQPGCSCKC